MKVKTAYRLLLVFLATLVLVIEWPFLSKEERNARSHKTAMLKEHVEALTPEQITLIGRDQFLKQLHRAALGRPIEILDPEDYS